MNVSTSGSIIILLLHLAQYDYFTGSTIDYKNTINTKSSLEIIIPSHQSVILAGETEVIISTSDCLPAMKEMIKSSKSQHNCYCCTSVTLIGDWLIISSDLP